MEPRSILRWIQSSTPSFQSASELVRVGFTQPLVGLVDGEGGSFWIRRIWDSVRASLETEATGIWGGWLPLWLSAPEEPLVELEAQVDVEPVVGRFIDGEFRVREAEHVIPGGHTQIVVKQDADRRTQPELRVLQAP